MKKIFIALGSIIQYLIWAYALYLFLNLVHYFILLTGREYFNAYGIGLRPYYFIYYIFATALIGLLIYYRIKLISDIKRRKFFLTITMSINIFIFIFVILDLVSKNG